MYLISPNILYQLRFIFLYLIYLYNQSIIKYQYNEDILLNSYHIIQYDDIHDLYISEYIFNIQIHCFINKKENIKIIYIYQYDNQISKCVIKNNITINPNNYNIICRIDYLDKYFIFNQLNIFECGIILHDNPIINNYYTYKGIQKKNSKII